MDQRNNMRPVVPDILEDRPHGDTAGFKSLVSEIIGENTGELQTEPKLLVAEAMLKHLEEVDQTLCEALESEIESGSVEEEDFDLEAKERILDYYRRSEGNQEGKEYLVRGALLQCCCGSNSRRMNLSPCHGVYFKEHPLVHKMDCKQGVEFRDNISWFGICDQNDLDTEKIVLVDDKGKNRTGKQCKPEIIGNWRNTYSGTKIAANHLPTEDYEMYDTLTMDSYLICRHGGIITPVESGQAREFSEEEIKTGDFFDDIRRHGNRHKGQ